MIHRLLLAGTGLLTLLGCASSPVMTDFDPAADFASYRSFAFLEPQPVVAAPPDLSPLIPPRIVNATRSELVAKGYVETEDGAEADLIVSFTLGARDRVQVTEYPSYYQRGPNDWGAPYYDEVDVRSYTEGTLAIDLFDVKKQAPVWHGKTSRAITNKIRENPAETIREAVAEIMAEYPPKAD